MELTNSQISIILKGICHSMLAMVKPSLQEINKMLIEFGMELVIKPQFYKYRSFPCMNFTWYVSGSDVRPDSTGHGILEWRINEDDAYRIMAEMNKFSHFTDLKVGNTDWDKVELNENLSAKLLNDLNFGYLLDKPTPQFGKFELTFEEAIAYLKENTFGKVTYESGTNGAHVHNSMYSGWFTWADNDGIGNSKWYKEGDDSFDFNDQYRSSEMWAIVG